MSDPINDGYKIYTTLVEINTRTGQPTGRVKPNIPTDPNYIAPAIDEDACPIPDAPIPDEYDVEIIIPGGFVANIELYYGTSHIDFTTSGTETIIDRTYDSIVFHVTTAGVPSYICKITYDDGDSFKETEVNGVENIFIPGPFSKITVIEIIANTGDFNNDFNDDFYN